MKKKSITKNVFIAMIVIGISFLLLSPILHGTVFYKSLTTSTSPNGTNIIEIKCKEAAFFGSNAVRVIIKQHINLFSKTEKYDSEICNDGGQLAIDNVQIIWENDDTATVILNGAEQKPEIIVVYFVPEIIIEQDIQVSCSM